jgi:hypothetical protein
MEVKSPWILLLVAMGLFGLASAACAQEVSVFAGGVFPGSVTVHDVLVSLDQSPIYGVRLSAPFALFLKAEGTFAFSNDFLFPEGTSGVTQAKGFLFDGNLVAGFPLGKVVPYVTAGFGLIYQYGSDNLPLGTKFDVNYGGGLKLPKLIGPIGLRFDARGRSAVRVFSHSVNMFEFSGGVMFSF